MDIGYRLSLKPLQESYRGSLDEIESSKAPKEEQILAKKVLYKSTYSQTRQICLQNRACAISRVFGVSGLKYRINSFCQNLSFKDLLLPPFNHLDQATKLSLNRYSQTGCLSDFPKSLVPLAMNYLHHIRSNLSKDTNTTINLLLSKKQHPLSDLDILSLFKNDLGADLITDKMNPLLDRCKSLPTKTDTSYAIDAVISSFSEEGIEVTAPNIDGDFIHKFQRWLKTLPSLNNGQLDIRNSKTEVIPNFKGLTFKRLCIEDCTEAKIIQGLGDYPLERLALGNLGKLRNVDGLEKLSSIRFLSLKNLPNVARLPDLQGLTIIHTLKIQDLPINRFVGKIIQLRDNQTFIAHIIKKIAEQDGHIKPCLQRIKDNFKECMALLTIAVVSYAIFSYQASSE